MVRGLFPAIARRTRIIGEAMEKGCAGVTCSGCGRVTDISWKLCPDVPSVSPQSGRQTVIGVPKSAGTSPRWTYANRLQRIFVACGLPKGFRRTTSRTKRN
jgi:hypothetical protein